jgi:GTP-binding protein
LRCARDQALRAGGTRARPRSRPRPPSRSSRWPASKAVEIGRRSPTPEHKAERLEGNSVECRPSRSTSSINNSPFAGKEGKFVSLAAGGATGCYKELERNVALRVEDTDSTDAWQVSGRGELHLSILMETMRREGYEFQVSRPRVILKTGVNGERSSRTRS